MLTGYPNIDKPWTKYYTDNAINSVIPDKTLFDYIYGNNKEFPDSIAIDYYGTKITYRDLMMQSHQYAFAFHDMGIRTGDIVTIMSMNTPETIFSLLGLNYIGAVANLIYITLTPQEIQRTVLETESKALIVLDAILQKIDKITTNLSIPIFVLKLSESMPFFKKIAFGLKKRVTYDSNLSKYYDLNKLVKKQRGQCNSIHCSDKSAAAVIVYTSGSTGVPKGVVLSNYNIVSLIFQCSLSGKNYKRGETSLLYLPPFTGYGIVMLSLGMALGIELYLWLNLEPKEIVTKFFKVRPNRIAAGISLVEPIMNHGCVKDMSWLIDYTGGGEGLPSDKERLFNDFLTEHKSAALYAAGYGMTESASALCMQQNKVFKPGSIGIPLPKVNIRIRDTNSGDDLKENQIGEMWFSAPNIMCGYYNNPVETKDAIETDSNGERWLRTGDLGRVDSDGFVFFEGRIKRIFLTRASDGTILKLFPQQIANLIESVDGVESCGVIVLPDKNSLNVAIAYVVLDNARRTNIIEYLKKLSKQELPEHMWPKDILTIDRMPHTLSGKIDYQSLSEYYINAHL